MSIWKRLSRASRPTSPIRRKRATVGLRVTPLEDRLTPAVFTGGVFVAAADLNGDGYMDVVSGPGAGGAPVVRAFSGRDGSVLRTFAAYDPNFGGGVSVAAADVDGDGRADIVTGAGPGGGPHVKVFSGRDGSLIREFFAFDASFRGGVSVAAADVDGDGRADIVAGAGPGGGPLVKIHSGRDGRILRESFAFDASFRGGVNVAAADVDGDGRADIVAGAGPGGGPHVKVFNGRNGTLLRSLFAFDQSFRGGASVAAGDADGDGKADLIVASGLTGPSQVRTLSGASGREIGSFVAFAPTFFGGVHVAVADFSGDGRTDIVTGAGPGGLPQVQFYLGAESTPRTVFRPYDPVALATPRGFSARTRVVVPPVSTNDIVDPGVGDVRGLEVNSPQVLAGTTEQLLFRAAAPAGSRVTLNEADARGVPGEFLLDLFDDGDFVHSDAVANDGVFSNTFSATFGQPRDTFYAAIIVGSSAAPMVTRVSSIAAPSAAVIDGHLAFAASRQSALASALTGGMPLAQALAATRSQLLAAPAEVVAASVEVTGRGVFWTDPAGFGHGVLSTIGSGDEKSGPSTSSPSASAAAAADPGCKGRALILAPFFSEFERKGGDESDEIEAQLRAAGYDVTILKDGAATAADFKNFGQYDAVVISSHGENKVTSGNQSVILTSESSASLKTTYRADSLAGRAIDVAGLVALTPAYFQYYSGAMNGTVVYASACRSALDSSLARTFLNLGAAAYAGYSDYVQPAFAVPLGIGMFRHLLQATGNTVNTIPNIGKAETDSTPARFRLFRRDANAMLTPRCDLLKDTQLLVTYTWPVTQKDLDTGTTFVGGSVGFACGGSSFMTFSGDDTSRGGKETVRVKLFESRQANTWTTSVPVELRAGWFIPAGGSGPATVSVELLNIRTGRTRGGVRRPIEPGRQSRCAETPVGTATVTVSGMPGNEMVSFTLP